MSILETHAETRHEGADDCGVGIWCDFHANKTGTGLIWNGSEKTYDAEAWVQYICTAFFAAWGIVANGELRAEGESQGDVWLLRVTDNKVSRVNGRIVFEEA